jgi:hypothetical protein
LFSSFLSILESLLDKDEGDKKYTPYALFSQAFDTFPKQLLICFFDLVLGTHLSWVGSDSFFKSLSIKYIQDKRWKYYYPVATTR